MFRNMNDDRIRPEIKALVERGNITKAEYESLRCKSWEWEAVVPALDDEALTAYVEHNLANCFPRTWNPCLTYPDALVVVLVPELLRRLRARPVQKECNVVRVCNDCDQEVRADNSCGCPDVYAGTPYDSEVLTQRDPGQQVGQPPSPE